MGSSAFIVEKTLSLRLENPVHEPGTGAGKSSGDFIKFIRRYFTAPLVGLFGFFLLAGVRHFRSFIAVCFTAT
jgi:hypothetical protein